jgi:hypothetical protein
VGTTALAAPWPVAAARAVGYGRLRRGSPHRRGPSGTPAYRRQARPGRRSPAPREAAGTLSRSGPRSARRRPHPAGRASTAGHPPPRPGPASACPATWTPGDRWGYSRPSRRRSSKGISMPGWTWELMSMNSLPRTSSGRARRSRTASVNWKPVENASIWVIPTAASLVRPEQDREPDPGREFVSGGDIRRCHCCTCSGVGGSSAGPPR